MLRIGIIAGRHFAGDGVTVQPDSISFSRTSL
jgi:hypothetical protein